MLVLLDRRQRAGRAVLEARAPLELGWLARFLQRRAARDLDRVRACSASSAWSGMQHFLKDPFEYDFRKLNAKLATTEEAQQFNQNLDKLFGRWPSPTIVLADQRRARSSRSRRRSGARTRSSRAPT